MRRLGSLLALLLAATSTVVLTAAPANAYQVNVQITGAGQVVEKTDAGELGTCIAPGNTPTGTVGASCTAGTTSGDYGWGWVVRYEAIASSGYRFSHWQSIGGAPLYCDGSNNSTTYSGAACQFATYNNHAIQAVFVDDTAPAMSSLSGPVQAVNGATTFTFSAASDPTFRRFECRVVGDPEWEVCSSGHQENPTLSGPYTFQVRAVDWSGNFSPVSNWNWTVDKVAPVTTMTSAPSGTVASTSATFAFTSNEPGTFSCVFNAVSTPCTSPTTLLGLGQGTQTFQVVARDVAGNNSPVVTRTWTVDTVAPETTLTGGPTEGTTVATASASFGLTSTDGTAFRCTLDGAPMPCTATTELTELGHGSHTFTAAAVDAVGNSDLTPAARTWTVDSTRPVVSAFGPSGTGISRTANVSAKFSEAMQGDTVRPAFLLTLSGTKVAATVTYKLTATGKYVATLDPKLTLKPRKTYKVALKSSALDAVGNALVAKSWTFTTRG